MSRHQQEPCTITTGLETVTKNLDNLRDEFFWLFKFKQKRNVINPVEQDMVKRIKVNKIP